MTPGPGERPREISNTPFISSAIFNCQELKFQHDLTIRFELKVQGSLPLIPGPGEKMKQLAF